LIKKLTIIGLLTLVLVGLPFTVGLRAQEEATPLTGLSAGALFENGSDAHLLVRGDFRQNLKTWKDETGQVTFQAYARPGFFRANDIGLNPEVSQKLHGFDLVGMIEYHTGKFFYGIGYGRAWELEDTVTIEVPVYAGVFGWQPAKPVRLYVGCDYYSRDQFTNTIGVYGGVAFELKELLE
jgi:hypothetical protein